MSQQKELKDGDSVQNPRVTWEGCSVLLDINDGDRLVFARLSSGSTLKIGNKNYSLKSLIGCPFGSVFQIQTGINGSVLSRVSSLAQGNDVQENRDCTVKEECKDNRTIVDNNTAQNLTGEDIDAMRSQGATADEIVEALIANSTTFEKKTLFSQEKYRLKKQKKYAPRVLLRQPFARSICETYFKKYPARIGFLRVDTLSLLLSMANVGPGSDVLVFDMVGGVLTGAVAERLGGTGYVCNTYLGDVPYPMDIVRIFNFSNKICESNSIHLKKIPMLDMATHELESVSVSSGPLQTRGSFELPPTHGIVRCSSTSLHSASNETANDIEGPKDSSNRENYLNVISAEEILSGNDADIITEAKTPVVKACKSMKAGERASKEAITLWKENGFSSLIIAAPDMDAWKIVQEFLPLLSYSAPFAIYHQYLQPLATCMHNLQLGRMAIGMQISEPWLREYQVLPSRTHPCMQMNAFGGYILSGTRICNSESHL